MTFKIGRVERYILERLEKKGALMFMLVDPVDYETPEHAIKTAREAEEGGADLILVGGSSGAQGELLDVVTKGIRETVSLPAVLFPGNIATLTKYAESMYFMSLLNARSTYWITHAQMLSAPIVKQMKIEPLPVDTSSCPLEGPSGGSATPTSCQGRSRRSRHLSRWRGSTWETGS